MFELIAIGCLAIVAATVVVMHNRLERMTTSEMWICGVTAFIFVCLVILDINLGNG